MTTRKTCGPAPLLLALAGCATPGPLRVYSLAGAHAETVRDVAAAPGPADEAREVASFLTPGEALTGFAYDPFTDHFFLRLAPGDVIRVVDRPARAIKRELADTGLPATGGGDLAVKPRSGHIFALDPGVPAVFELTRLGKPVRNFRLQGASAAPQGIAYDAARDQLVVLFAGGATAEIVRYDLTGAPLRRGALSQPVLPSLAYDADRDECYAPLAPEGREIGVFNADGQLVRTHATPAAYVDVGPRSFLRVF